MTTLFDPLHLGALELPNRVLMAPMTRNRAPDTVPTPLMAVYYAQRAEAGLIITEATQVSPQGVGYPATPGIHTEAQVSGWRRVTQAVHDAGGRIFCQLWHVGRISHPDLQPDGALPVAPSAVRPQGEAFTPQGPKPFVTPRALEADEIPGVIEQFARAAENARRAGFDGVEIHAANGYLIDQFLRDGSNRRTDAWGGPPERRARLLVEVTAAVVEVWGGGRVGVRLSPLNPFNDMRDSNPEATFLCPVRALQRFGLAYLHVTEAGAETPGAAGPAFDLAVLRRAWRGVYVANGGYDPARAAEAVGEGRADAVAFGRLFLANPDLVTRLRLGAPLNEPDPATFYGGGERGYTDYPTLEAAGGGAPADPAG
ncbi:alkene reductase [Inmirania thermothiophila]|uniref:N-ethylmaleimide reductase n=1 Tax=Inmirania thermothiophila TaxID=1750597 RepID=A0A3N1Y1Q3_9GAMM|nr:alkene reductase [Inmirania thermothiophila]ROR32749.1 N-ethylmaleimide reductase [Inmirania thermothiophila]